MHDSDMLLTVDLDIADAQTTAKKLDKEVQAIFNSRNGKQSAALTSVESQIKQSLYRVRELREAILKIGETPVPTEQYATLSKHLEEYVNEYDKLIEKASQLEETDQLNSDAYLKVATRIEQVEAQMDSLTRRKEELERRGQAYISGRETDEYKKREAELDKELDRLKQQLVRRQEISKHENEELHTQTQINSKFRQVPRLLMRYALGVGSIYVLWRKIRQAIAEGLQNLKDSDIGDYKDIVNDLNASTLTLKNTLASVLAPILTAVIPYIQSFVDSLSDALDKLAQLIAAAQGQTTYIRAIRQTGDAIERMGKQANKALSPLDNLNVITATPTMFEEAEISEETFAQLDDFLATLDLLKVALEGIAGLAVAATILDFVDSLDILSGSSSLRKLASASGSLSKLLKYLGKLAAIGAITIGVTLLIDSVLKDQTGMGLGDWVGSFLAGTLDWQKEFDDWWETNINKPAETWAWNIFVDMPKNLANDPAANNAWKSVWHLLTPSGWKDMFIDEPIRLIKELGEWFRTPKAPSWDDLPFVAKSPNKAQSAIQSIIDKVQELINKWRELKGLTTEEFEVVKEEIQKEVTAQQSYKNVLANNTVGNQNKFNQLQREFVYEPLDKTLVVEKQIESSLDQIVEDLRGNLKLPTVEQKLDDMAKTLKLPNVIGLPKIRGYAAGQVIPPSMSKHLAILGDNKQETEVVSPLSTMQEAMLNALREAGGVGGTQEIILNLDGREFMRAMVKQNSEYKKQHNGASAFA